MTPRRESVETSKQLENFVDRIEEVVDTFGVAISYLGTKPPYSRYEQAER